MPYSEKSDSIIIVEGLTQSIQSTTTLVQSLMSELRDNSTALATLEAKLQALHENMQGIIKVVRDDNGNKSIVTRMALVEKELKDIDERYSNLKDEIEKKFVEVKVILEKMSDDKEVEKEKADKEKEFGRDKIITILKIIPGLLALGYAIIDMLSK